MDDNLVQQQAQLSPGDIAGLIRLHQVAVTPGSPLAPFVNADEPVTQAALNQRGLHRAPWRNAFAALAAPGREVRLLVPAPAEMLVSVFYGGPDKGDLVGCWPEEDGLRVSYPWQDDQVLALAWQVLLATDPPPADELSFQLSLPGLTALAAAVDSLRALLFRSYLYRETNVPLAITRGALADQLEQGLGKADARWLVTLLNLTGSSYFPLAPGDLADGMSELVAAGLLTAEGEAWLPSVALQRLALHWRSPLPAVAVETIIVAAQCKITQYGHRIVLRGDGPLWQIDYGPAVWQARPQVTLAGAGPAECFQSLAALLASPAAVPQRQPVAEAALAPQPGAVAGPASKPGPGACPHCGQAVSPGAKFCGYCGGPIIAKD